jgi:hypothetical protein
MEFLLAHSGVAAPLRAQSAVYSKQKLTRHSEQNYTRADFL